MAYIITDPCVSTCDTACANVCPVDAIAGPIDVTAIVAMSAVGRPAGLQLFIDPNVCISCALCVPECPVGAIFEESEVPEQWRGAIERNAAFFGQ